MRTVTEMVAQLRLLLHDPDSKKFRSDEQVTLRLKDAADMVWDMLVDDPRGQHILLVKSSPTAIVANMETYLVPSDCLRMRSVEFRVLTTLYATLTCGVTPKILHTDWTGTTSGSFRIFCDDRPVDVRNINFAAATSMADVASILQTALRAATRGTPTVTWSAADSWFVFAAYNTIQVLGASDDASIATVEDISGALWLNGAAGTPAVSSSVQSFLPVPYGVQDIATIPQLASGTAAILGSPTTGGEVEGWSGMGDGYIRIYPRTSSVTGVYRMLYYRKPVWPTVAATPIFNVPNGIDMLIEYLAGAYLAGEKVEDKGALLEIDYFGNSFNGKWENFLRGRGGGQVKPSRRYIHSTE